MSNHTHHAISLPKADKHASTMNINYVKRATVNTPNDPQIDYVIFSYFSALIRPLTWERERKENLNIIIINWKNDNEILMTLEFLWLMYCWFNIFSLIDQKAPEKPQNDKHTHIFIIIMENMSIVSCITHTSSTLYKLIRQNKFPLHGKNEEFKKIINWWRLYTYKMICYHFVFFIYAQLERERERERIDCSFYEVITICSGTFYNNFFHCRELFFYVWNSIAIASNIDLSISLC